MRVSIWPGPVKTWNDIRATARHADDTGWDGVYVMDHFMPPNDVTHPGDHPVIEAGSAVAALAALMPRLRIGTLVLANTYRHPAVVANMAATIDHISAGRFTLGLGAGWQANEHEQYGIDLPAVGERIDRFAEAVQVVRGLLENTRTTFDGKYYRLNDATCEPKPVQERLPILIGAAGEKRMLRIVAEHADVWNCWGDPDLIAHKSAVLDRHCAEAGRDPGQIRRTAQALAVIDGAPPTGLPLPVIGGSVAKLAAAIDRYRAIGLDELIIPDVTLGQGAEKYKAMDVIRDLVQR
ncbi:TIGR03560 family F420-dependent LLM class oxidoreductase [Micromonospora musae]|uniref:TIGR03560 family F420-dependent LLM class oxidoreductase n=1 Tax=Micromonospora musae TaxID=1894970 RepID=UPI00340CE76C